MLCQRNDFPISILQSQSEEERYKDIRTKLTTILNEREGKYAQADINVSLADSKSQDGQASAALVAYRQDFASYISGALWFHKSLGLTVRSSQIRHSIFDGPPQCETPCGMDQLVLLYTG